MIPRPYQIKHSQEIYEILKEHLLVYISWEERTGKSLTSLLVAERTPMQHLLVITKAKAYKDWVKLIEDYKPSLQVDVVTYGKLKNYTGDPDIVILDEAHSYLSAYPKPGSTWKTVYKYVYGKPIIYLSATPHAQGRQQLYYQFRLSKWSPFRHFNTFYDWFRSYGIPYTIEVHGKDVPQYTRAKDSEIEHATRHLFHTKTRAELDFPFEPEDRIHYIELSGPTKKLYNDMLEHKVYTTQGQIILLDTPIKLRSFLHCLEGGTAKLTVYQPAAIDALLVTTEKIKKEIITSYYIDMGNREKINYILEHWGDTKDLCIMYNYKGELPLLKRYFKHAAILQATSFAEGVELSHIRHLVIYSQDFSTARHTQRRARQASMSREHPIDVHFLLVRKAVSEQVYNTVAKNKKNFVDSLFKRTKL